MKKCLRCQMRLLVRSPGFWVAMAFGVLYAVGYFVAMCLRNMHLDAIAQPTPYSAYSTHGFSFTAPYFMLSLIHISEPTRQAEISYAVFCLKKKKTRKQKKNKKQKQKKVQEQN